MEVGPNTECDTNAGEVYRQQSPGKLPSLDDCKKSCQGDPACKSVTYYKTGWCSHYSTPCSKTKRKGKAVSLRLVGGSGSTTTASLTTTRNPNTKWVQVRTNAVCDPSAGEVYRQQSPGKLSNLDDCKTSCENDNGCKSITFFKSGWCSHYSTACANVKNTNKAVSAWRLTTGQRQMRSS